MPAVEAIVFDLDNCLLATAEIGAALVEPALAAIRAVNRGRLSEARLQAAFADIWRHPLDWVAHRHDFSDAMRAAAWREFARLRVDTPLRGYDDLATLPELPVARFLVTSGFRVLQQSKIDALGLTPMFTGIHIDAIDEPARQGKQALFARILSDHDLHPAHVLVVGDSAESEIAAGNRLGMRTVQILRPGVPCAANASLHISGLVDLHALLAGCPPRRPPGTTADTPTSR
ncbi:MAG TPA: HAD family hydrolase [Accumulibacter sp.]|jgi:putative hydrolase of the HAD superfamily|nr:HAD family hydrolase [Accumulibacter sp.]